jgi:hypothetical protein
VSDQVSFVGGMNVPAVFGRANATMPLAELIIDDSTLTLRPRWFASLMMTKFEVDLTQIDSAYPLTGTVMTPGIGFTLLGGANVYFWTRRDKAKILNELAPRGVQVYAEPRRAHPMRISGGRADAATLPRMPQSLRFLMPVLLVLGLVLGLTAVAAAPNTQTRVIQLAIGAFALVVSLLWWWRSRDTT